MCCPDKAVIQSNRGAHKQADSFAPIPAPLDAVIGTTIEQARTLHLADA